MFSLAHRCIFYKGCFQRNTYTPVKHHFENELICLLETIVFGDSQHFSHTCTLSRFKNWNILACVEGNTVTDGTESSDLWTEHFVNGGLEHNGTHCKRNVPARIFVNGTAHFVYRTERFVNGTVWKWNAFDSFVYV